VVSTVEPGALRAETAAAMLQVSRATIYRLLKDKKLEPVRLPGCRAMRVSLASIRKLAQPGTEMLAG
jgi:excisionase family DNA binding protein